MHLIHLHVVAASVVASAFIAAPAKAFAQDAVAGKRLYFDAARLRGTGQSCVDCHFALPGVFGISGAANDPQRIQRAIDSRPQMEMFRGRLSAADVADLAAYIGQPGVPSPELRTSTSSGAADRVDFGAVTAGSTAGAQWRLTNAGALPLQLTSAPQIGGDHPADFAIGAASTCSNGSVLAAGANCDIEIRFTPPPGATGTRRAALQIGHDWIGGQAGVALLGQPQPSGNPAAAPIGASAGGGGGVTGSGWLLGLLTAVVVRLRSRH